MEGQDDSNQVAGDSRLPRWAWAAIAGVSLLTLCWTVYHFSLFHERPWYWPWEWWHTRLNESEQASWFEAVGTFLAVVAALGTLVIERQIELNDRRAEDRKKRENERAEQRMERVHALVSLIPLMQRLKHWIDDLEDRVTKAAGNQVTRDSWDRYFVFPSTSWITAVSLRAFEESDHLLLYQTYALAEEYNAMIESFQEPGVPNHWTLNAGATQLVPAIRYLKRLVLKAEERVVVLAKEAQLRPAV